MIDLTKLYLRNDAESGFTNVTDGDGISAAQYNIMIKEMARVFQNRSGWADYEDNVYTEASPFSLSADTDTIIPNNAGVVVNSQIPSDLTTLVTQIDVGGAYFSQKIDGRDGDSIIFTLDFKVKPTSAAATLIETWVDIGGAVGELYRRPDSFPKGVGIERNILSSTGAYMLDTWEANGGTVYFRANGACQIYDIRFVIFVNHRALV